MNVISRGDNNNNPPKKYEGKCKNCGSVVSYFESEVVLEGFAGYKGFKHSRDKCPVCNKVTIVVETW